MMLLLFYFYTIERSWLVGLCIVIIITQILEFFTFLNNVKKCKNNFKYDEIILILLSYSLT